MSKFQRRHYEVFALALAENKHALDYTTLCKIFKADNPRFDSKRFSDRIDQHINNRCVLLAINEARRIEAIKKREAEKAE